MVPVAWVSCGRYGKTACKRYLESVNFIANDSFVFCNCVLCIKLETGYFVAARYA